MAADDGDVAALRHVHVVALGAHEIGADLAVADRRPARPRLDVMPDVGCAKARIVAGEFADRADIQTVRLSGAGPVVEDVAVVDDERAIDETRGSKQAVLAAVDLRATDEQVSRLVTKRRADAIAGGARD